MLTDSEIEELFCDLESDRVERKESASDGDRIRQAICAFANDLPNYGKPGVIFIGQRDDGSCAKLEIDDRLLQKLGGWRSDGNIQPFPMMSVARKTINDCAVVVIVVEPSDNPPVRADGRTWIRVGPRRGLATPQEEQRLIEKRRWGNLPFDQQGVRGATLDDLDLVRFRLEYLPSIISRDTLEQNGRTIEQQLLGLRLVRPDLTPTVAALLLLGKDTQGFFPGAFIQWRRVNGTAIADDTIDERRIVGTVIDQALRVDAFLETAITQSLVVHVGKHERTATYPLVALQQIVRNALMHRNYEGTNAPVRVTWLEDRIEILSPGGPYGSVTIDNIGKPGATDYRNPTLAEAFRAYRLVERFGVGFLISREALLNNGNPELELQAVPTYVNVTIRKAT